MESKNDTEVKTWWNNASKVILIIAVVLALYIFVLQYWSLKQDDFSKEYSKYCSDQAVRDFWDEYSWVKFTNEFYKVDGKHYFRWSFDNNWSYVDFYCYLKNKDDVTVDVETELNVKSDLDSLDSRISACEGVAWFLLNYNEWKFTWGVESSEYFNYQLTGHVNYIKWWEKAEDDVICHIDARSHYVNVLFKNHVYNWPVGSEDEFLSWSN